MGWINIKQIFSKTGDRLFEDTNGIVKINGSKVSARTVLINSSTVAVNGAIFPVVDYKKVSVEIYGTATSFELKFKGSVNSPSVLVPVGAVNLESFDVSSSAIASGIYSLDVTGFESFSVELVSVTGGNINVVCRGAI